MNSILKEVFKYYIRIRDMEPKKQFIVFMSILGVWTAFDYAYKYGYIAKLIGIFK